MRASVLFILSRTHQPERVITKNWQISPYIHGFFPFVLFPAPAKGLSDASLAVEPFDLVRGGASEAAEDAELVRLADPALDLLPAEPVRPGASCASAGFEGTLSCCPSYQWKLRHQLRAGRSIGAGCPIESAAAPPPKDVAAAAPDDDAVEAALIRLPAPTNAEAAAGCECSFSSSSAAATFLSSYGESAKRESDGEGAAAAAAAAACKERPSSKSQLMSLSMMHTPSPLRRTLPDLS